jgi:hypothetical protein
MKTSTLHRLSAAVLTTCLAFGVGCSSSHVNGEDPASGDGTGAATGADGTRAGDDGRGVSSGTPCSGKGVKVLARCNAAKGEYVAIEGAERDAIANEMWTALTGAPCWFKNQSSQQYVFYGQLQYTFWGQVADSKSGGTLGVDSVGRFEDKNAAVVIIRSEPWLLVTIDPQTFTLGKYINGQPYIELYKAQMDGRCI